MRILTFFAALTLCSIAPYSLAKGDPEEGRLKAYTCTGCHGIPGYKNSYPMFKVPKIGGQNAAYLKSALEAYQSGVRRHGTMMLQAESLSAADIDDISAWLSIGSTNRAAAEHDPGMDAPEKIQLCQTCHGVDGLGTDPSYPVLAGQHSSYISRALEDYREGVRKNAIMGGFAADLTDHDIESLANWYAGMSALTDLSER